MRPVRNTGLSPELVLRTVGSILVSLVAPMVAAQPAAADGDRQTVRASLTTNLPDTPSGNRLDVEWHDPDDPNAKPPAIDTVVIDLPPGSRRDFSAVPQCKSSDVELMLRGTAACPADSVVSTGHTLVDTGSAGGFPRFLNVNTVMFNNEAEMIGLGETVEMPFRTVVRTKMEGERATLPMPDNPGAPPDGRSSFKRLTFVAPPIVRDGRALARTPPTCPASGLWTTHYTFIYHDGVRQTETTQWPCTSAATGRRPCLPDRLRVRSLGIGPVRLGRTRAALHALPIRPPRGNGARLSWCVDGGRGRVTALFDRRGRAVLALTTARRHGRRGVRPGRGARMVRAAYPNRQRLARGLIRASPRSRLLIGVRAGRVRFVAVAAQKLVPHRRALVRAVRRALVRPAQREKRNGGAR